MCFFDELNLGELSLLIHLVLFVFIIFAQVWVNANQKNITTQEMFWPPSAITLSIMRCVRMSPGTGCRFHTMALRSNGPLVPSSR